MSAFWEDIRFVCSSTAQLVKMQDERGGRDQRKKVKCRGRNGALPRPDTGYPVLQGQRGKKATAGGGVGMLKGNRASLRGVPRRGTTLRYTKRKAQNCSSTGRK